MTDDMNNYSHNQEPRDDEPESTITGSNEPSSSFAFSNGPEPPMRWNPATSETPDSFPPVTELQDDSQASQYNAATSTTKMGAIGKVRFKLHGSEVSEFESARRYIMAAQFVAIISLFFGGLVISIIAVMLACVANSKLDKLAASRDAEPEAQAALRRSGKMIIAAAAFAAALNLLAIIFLYPLVAGNLQAGDLSSLTSTIGGTGAGALGGNSTWG